MIPTLAVYLHRLDPVLVSFTDTLAVRWYGLSYIAGFVAAYLIIRAMAKRGRALVDPAKVGDLILALAVGTVVGGRLGYVLLYQPALLVDFGGGFPWWGVLALNRGGMASHGGVVGIVLGGIWFARREGVLKLHVLDLAALASTVGIFFGRVANFINGELYGRVADATLPWAVRFPQAMSDWNANVRDALDPKSTIDPAVAEWSMAKLRELGEAVHAVDVSPQRWASWLDAYATSADARYGVGVTIDRMIGATRGSSEFGDTVAAALAPVLEPRHPSQLYEAGLEGLALFALLFLLWMKPRRPGVIGAAFLWGYAAVRIIGEQFRMPDQHLGFQALGLTRGQWLSVGMLAIGIGLAIYWGRRPVERICGWSGPRVQPPAGASAEEAAEPR